MKKLMRTFALMAVAALGLSACTGEKLVPDNGNADGKFVTVHFGAEAAIEGATKATLTTEDEKTFKSAWENGDALSVEYISPKTADNKIITATWDGTSFEAKGLPNETGAWDYTACYPKPDEKDNHIDFGRVRTQKGSAYNSIYDVMIGNKSTKNSAAGKDDDGSNVVFNMTRQTAVAYFHLTGGPADEKVVSATLSVEDGFIASQHAYITDFVFAPTEDLKEITITYKEGTAPMASNFQLWFNVLPTMYTKMTLTVETANHTLTISRNAPEIDEYVAGKLYKVVKNTADKWVKKGGETPSTKDFTLVTSALSDWTGSYLLVGEYSTETTPKSYYAFDESIYVDNTWGKCSEIVVDNNTIASTYGTMALEIVPGTTANTYSIMTPSGKYLSASAAKKFNLSETYSADNCDFAISFGDKNEIIIKQASSLTLEEAKHRQIRYNYSNGNGGFRWYEGLSVDPVYLYKGPSVAKYSVFYGTVEGGSFSASSSRAEAGAEITLKATPVEGYAFNNHWLVKGADETVIEVVDGKFTMPAQNVTISGSFSKVAYTITKAAAENGSFTVKNGTEEVATAFKGDKLTLEATPAEGFTFGKWTVTYMDGETEKSFNPSANTFNMPAANVTVSATFVETAAVPVYASVAELIAAGKPTTNGTKVTVTLKDEEITKFYKIGTYTNGVYFMVGTQEVEIYCKDVPESWVIGGYVSGTLTNCTWKLFSSTWELCPANWSELTYAAPCATPEITLNGAEASITCTTEGATIRYTLDGKDPVETSDVYTAVVTLTDGQTIKAKAFLTGHKPSEVASKKYSSTGGDPTEQTVFLETFGSTTSNTAVASYTGYSATADMFTTSEDVKTHYSGDGSVGKNNLSSSNLSSGYTGASGLSGCYHVGTANTEKTILQISNIDITDCVNISVSFGALGGSSSHKVSVYYSIDGGAETALITNGAITNANWTLLNANIAGTGKSLTLIFKHKPTKAWTIRMDDIKVVGTK